MAQIEMLCPTCVQALCGTASQINSCLKVSKVGLVEAKFTQPLEGEIKTVTIKVTPSGKYYAAIGLDLGDVEVEQSTDGVITGIDLGLKDREWTCSQCSTHHLRDDNASRNIRAEGMKILGLGHSLHGDDVRLRACSEQLSAKRLPAESLL